ncbi:hypothetical protein PHMEG_00018951 [Phytophthora megakarya]|uniref:Uncharacterized protein n=1 Tax=Phytophthora megakarya TaxID=4795 RepID=A0A225VSS0_9STRA|nr:hypothetical protein PHMEG_00018951 [Phytophthora megakarya]
MRFLFTRDLVEEGRLDIQYCSTSDMAADVLIKALQTGQFIKLGELIGVKNLKTTGDTKWECLTWYFDQHHGDASILRGPMNNPRMALIEQVTTL